MTAIAGGNTVQVAPAFVLDVLAKRDLTFAGVDEINPGPRVRFVAKAAKVNCRVEAMGHTPQDAVIKLVRLVEMR